MRRPRAWPCLNCQRTCSSERSTNWSKADLAWVPGNDGSLYLRPFLFATEAFLGVRPSYEYLFVLIASSVGAYFKGGEQGRHCLAVGSLHTRSGGRHGRGQSAAAIMRRACWRRPKRSSTAAIRFVFLGRREHRWVEELGGMNVFFVFDDGSIQTPAAERHDPAGHHPRFDSLARAA